MKKTGLITLLVLFVVLLALWGIWFIKPSDLTSNNQIDVVKPNELAHSHVRVGSEHDRHHAVDHDPYQGDIENLAEEYTEDLIERHIMGGPDAYRNLKLMATQDRILEYGAIVEPLAGYESLFSSIEVTPNDVADFVRNTSITVIENKMRIEGEGAEPVTVGDPSLSQINIGESLKRGDLPLKLYDIALSSAQDALLEQRLLMSFYGKNNLTPRENNISIVTEQTKQGTLVVIRTPNGTYHELLEDLADPKSLDRMTQKKVDDLRRELGAKAFANQANTILTPVEIRDYFPRKGVVDERNVIRFLKDRAKIVKQLPTEVKDDLKLN